MSVETSTTTPLPETRAPQQHGLLSLPNEILLDIISYLRPTDSPVAYLKALIFRPWRPYYQDTTRTESLRSLTQASRDLHTVTEVVLSDERKLEKDTLQECRATAEWLNKC